MAETTVSLDHLIALRGKARGYSFLPRQPVQSILAGRHGSRLRGRGLTFEELRHYQPGDDVRTIDWKATARRRETYVRVYNEEREREVYILLDQRPDMFFGSRMAMKSVCAAELAALAAWRATAQGDRVGGIVFNQNEIVEVPARRGNSGALRLLHPVSRLNQSLTQKPVTNPRESNARLNEVLQAVSARARHDTLIVLLSDFAGANEETRRLVTRLAAGNDMIAGLVYDPMGIVLSGETGMVAQTSTGDRVPVPTDASFSKRFQAVFEEQLAYWTGAFGALRVPVIPFNAADDPVHQIRRLFGGETTMGQLR